MTKESKKISIGKRIKDVFKKTGMDLSQFAELLNYERTNPKEKTRNITQQWVLLISLRISSPFVVHIILM